MSFGINETKKRGAEGGAEACSLFVRGMA